METPLSRTDALTPSAGSDSEEVQSPKIAFTTLHTADVGAIQIRLVREILLRDARSLTELAYAQAKL